MYWCSKCLFGPQVPDKKNKSSFKGSIDWKEELLWKLIGDAKRARKEERARAAHEDIPTVLLTRFGFRDLKPSNVFLHGKRALLGDFGLACFVNPQSQLARTKVGTPLYFSPELCVGKPYGLKSDMWALGCVIHELVTGRPPFLAQNEVALAHKVLKQQTPSLPPQYSPNLHKLADLLLQKNPQRRPDTAALLNNGFIQQQLVCALGKLSLVHVQPEVRVLLQQHDSVKNKRNVEDSSREGNSTKNSSKNQVGSQVQQQAGPTQVVVKQAQAVEKQFQQKHQVHKARRDSRGQDAQAEVQRRLASDKDQQGSTQVDQQEKLRVQESVTSKLSSQKEKEIYEGKVKETEQESRDKQREQRYQSNESKDEHVQTINAAGSCGVETGRVRSGGLSNEKMSKVSKEVCEDQRSGQTKQIMQQQDYLQSVQQQQQPTSKNISRFSQGEHGYIQGGEIQTKNIPDSKRFNDINAHGGLASHIQMPQQQGQKVAMHEELNHPQISSSRVQMGDNTTQKCHNTSNDASAQIVETHVKGKQRIPVQQESQDAKLYPQQNDGDRENNPGAGNAKVGLEQNYLDTQQPLDTNDSLEINGQNKLDGIELAPYAVGKAEDEKQMQKFQIPMRTSALLRIIQHLGFLHNIQLHIRGTKIEAPPSVVAAKTPCYTYTLNLPPDIYHQPFLVFSCGAKEAHAAFQWADVQQPLQPAAMFKLRYGIQINDPEKGHLSNEYCTCHVFGGDKTYNDEKKLLIVWSGCMSEVLGCSFSGELQSVFQSHFKQRSIGGKRVAPMEFVVRSWQLSLAQLQLVKSSEEAVQQIQKGTNFCQKQQEQRQAEFISSAGGQHQKATKEIDSKANHNRSSAVRKTDTLSDSVVGQNQCISSDSEKTVAQPINQVEPNGSQLEVDSRQDVSVEQQRQHTVLVSSEGQNSLNRAQSGFQKYRASSQSSQPDHKKYSLESEQMVRMPAQDLYIADSNKYMLEVRNQLHQPKVKPSLRTMQHEYNIAQHQYIGQPPQNPAMPIEVQSSIQSAPQRDSSQNQVDPRPHSRAGSNSSLPNQSGVEVPKDNQASLFKIADQKPMPKRASQTPTQKHIRKDLTLQKNVLKTPKGIEGVNNKDKRLPNAEVDVSKLGKHTTAQNFEKFEQQSIQARQILKRQVTPKRSVHVDNSKQGKYQRASQPSQMAFSPKLAHLKSVSHTSSHSVVQQASGTLSSEESRSLKNIHSGKHKDLKQPINSFPTEQGSGTRKGSGVANDKVSQSRQKSPIERVSNCASSSSRPEVPMQHPSPAEGSSTTNLMQGISTSSQQGQMSKDLDHKSTNAVQNVHNQAYQAPVQPSSDYLVSDKQKAPGVRVPKGDRVSFASRQKTPVKQYSQPSIECTGKAQPRTVAAAYKGGMDNLNSNVKNSRMQATPKKTSAFDIYTQTSSFPDWYTCPGKSETQREFRSVYAQPQHTMASQSKQVYSDYSFQQKIVVAQDTGDQSSYVLQATHSQPLKESSENTYSKSKQLLVNDHVTNVKHSDPTFYTSSSHLSQIPDDQRLAYYDKQKTTERGGSLKQVYKSDSASSTYDVQVRKHQQRVAAWSQKLVGEKYNLGLGIQHIGGSSNIPKKSELSNALQNTQEPSQSTTTHTQVNLHCKQTPRFTRHSSTVPSHESGIAQNSHQDQVSGIRKSSSTKIPSPKYTTQAGSWYSSDNNGTRRPGSFTPTKPEVHTNEMYIDRPSRLLKTEVAPYKKGMDYDVSYATEQRGPSPWPPSPQTVDYLMKNRKSGGVKGTGI